MANKRAPLRDREDAFLAAFSQSVASPSDSVPTTRCWTEATLKRHCNTLRESMPEGLAPKGSAQALIDRLVRLGLALRVNADGATFYVLDLGGGAQTQVDPYELLMAIRPVGIVSYFSAVAFHSLTTQHVAHHHIAELTPSAITPRRPEPVRAHEEPAPVNSPAAATRPPSLGKLLFMHQGIPYYLTSRSERMVPGVQVRSYGPRSRIRITTVEQTLLDLLFKPFSGGGPSVVFEAWREALSAGVIDEERMTQYLAMMNYPATTRRVGAMLTLLGHAAGLELRRMLEQCRAALDRHAPHATISLLPGVHYSSIDNDWLVSVP